ncbi:MAG: DUF5103 domain-containing protein [Alloprevotella sp.]|nr:DUF5103 domain-containing protein [Alloprevotella sp.]
MKPVRALILSVLALLLLAQPIAAQRNRTLTQQIRTLQVQNLSRDWGLPIVRLDSNDQLLVSFDYMDEEYHRFVYKIVHLTADFEPTADLFESDFVANTAETEPIDDYEESMNTITHYVHYQFAFPNINVRPRLSGNYRIDILLDEDDEPTPVAQVYFAVLDSQVGAGIGVTTDTDIDWNRNHQQVELHLTTPSLEVVDPQSELYVVVLQNKRWDNAAINPPATHIGNHEYRWFHSRPLIFEAGNEYRRFEMLSTRYPGIGLERMQWFAPFYHATVFADETRPNYLYEQDINGRFVVRTEDNTDAASESEYAWVHFTLDCDEIKGSDVYVDGDFSDNRFLPANRLEYNASRGAYEGAVFLKTGYYNYHYLTVRHGETEGHTYATEGNHYQTENEYDALIYYKRRGSRYWQLVGHAHSDFKLTQ